jgi:hypothetical protein
VVRSTLLIAALAAAAVHAPAEVVIDFSRDADLVPGPDFDNNTATVTVPIDPNDPARTISLTGSAGSTFTELVLETFSNAPFQYGVQTDVNNANEDSLINDSGNDELAFSFNFDGALTGLDVTGLVGDDRANLSKSASGGTSTTGFVLESFYANSPPANTITLDADQSVTNLTDIDDTFFTFSAGDVFTLTAGLGGNYGLQTITVIPTPTTAALLIPALGLLRRRRAD